MHLRRSVGRSLHIQLVGHQSLLAASYFLPDGFHLYVIYLIQVLLYLHSVDEVSPRSDILLAQIAFLILARLGFYSDAPLLGLDSVSNSTDGPLLSSTIIPIFEICAPIILFQILTLIPRVIVLLVMVITIIVLG